MPGAQRDTAAESVSNDRIVCAQPADGYIPVFFTTGVLACLPMKSNLRRAQPGVLGKGHPGKLRFSSLFLPDVESDAVLDGITLGAVMKAEGEESFWKSMRTLQARHDAGTSKPPTRHLTQKLRSIYEQFPPSPVRDEALGHLAGDWRHAMPSEEIAGLWSLVRALAAGEDLGRWASRIDHYVELETACSNATARVLAGDYRGAADAVAHAPMLVEYMNPTALEMLTKSSTELQTLDPRFAGFIEFMLSHVARVDVTTAMLDLDCDSDIHALLLPGHGGAIDPGSALVRTAIQILGLRSQAELLRLDTRETAIDESTLKRWGRGTSFPSNQSLSAFFDAAVETLGPLQGGAVHHDVRRRRLDRVQWAATRLHVLMNLVRQPGLPPYIFRSLGVEPWARQRYSFWRQHWHSAGLAKLSHCLVAMTPS